MAELCFVYLRSLLAVQTVQGAFARAVWLAFCHVTLACMCMCMWCYEWYPYASGTVVAQRQAVFFREQPV